ncbi:MAG: cation diffusion facilitator family transporter [Desulfosarcinaceae bacterium]|jgi:cobalt-zinc-cadmium efflux system protein
MHRHAHHYSRYNRAFLVGAGLNTVFVVIEAAYGFAAGSLALVADAGHNLSDVLGLLLAWGGAFLAGRKTTPRRTYGWRRATIYAPLLNAVILLLTVGGVGWESLRRFFDPSPAGSMTMIIVAAVGIAVNTITALLFTSGRRRDVNIRGAFVHMAADAAVSLGVVAAGAGIALTGWLWLDPLVSLIISLVILFGTTQLLRDAVNLAMDAVPGGIDPHEVRGYLSSLGGVVRVHDLHIWALSATETALTAHLEHDETADPHAVTIAAGEQLNERFDIGHSTLQWERISGDDGTACEHGCEWQAGGPSHHRE